MIDMFAKSIMIPKFHCHVIQHDETIHAALDKLEKYNVDGLPVLKGNSYKGIITRYLIYKHFFESESSRETYVHETLAADIATHQESFLTGKEIFERTLIDLKDFPILAVVDEKGEFLGAVTRSDVVEQFKSAFGMLRPGIRIAFTTVETEGRIARLSEIAHQYREHIISLVTFDETDKLVRRIVMKVEKKSNTQKFIKKLEDAGFGILDIQEDE